MWEEAFLKALLFLVFKQYSVYCLVKYFCWYYFPLLCIVFLCRRLLRAVKLWWHLCRSHWDVQQGSCSLSLGYRAKYYSSQRKPNYSIGEDIWREVSNLHCFSSQEPKAWAYLPCCDCFLIIAWGFLSHKLSINCSIIRRNPAALANMNSLYCRFKFIFPKCDVWLGSLSTVPENVILVPFQSNDLPNCTG